MKYRIRKVTEYREKEQVFALDLLCFSADDGSLGSIEDLNGSDWWLVWDENNEPVGYCGIVVYDGFAIHKRCGVLPRARGNGLQKKMLRLRENFARKAGCESVSTYVSIYNAPSANNLIKSGYRVYNPEWRWGGDEFLYVEKVL
jgi:RimJ/RimL family protein N-acetyltransferase